MEAIMLNNEHSRLMFEKLKPKLPARKSSLIQILQNKYIKTLKNKKSKLNPKIKSPKKQEPKKQRNRSLVYKVQAARHGRKMAVKMNAIKKKLKLKMALIKKNEELLEETRQQTQETQTEADFVPNTENDIREELKEFIDKLIDSKLQALRPVHIENQKPLAQYATIKEKPLVGHRFECDVSELPIQHEILWQMLQDGSPNKDYAYWRMKQANNLEVSTIAQEREPYPEGIAYRSNGQRPCWGLRECLSLLSLFGMLFILFIYLYYGPIRQQPLTNWELFLDNLNYFLRRYLYIDVTNE